MRNALTSIIFLLMVSVNAQEYSFIELFQMMDSSITANTELEFTFLKEERIEETYEYSTSEVKVQNIDQFCVYMKSNTPREGLEILYREGENDGDVLINTNSFPYININLDPMGDLIRIDQHHTIHDLGFFTIQGIVKNFIESLGDSLEKYIKRYPDYSWDGIDCYKILVDYTDYTYFEYTVQEGEDVDDIADRFHVNAYMILEKNDDLDDYDDVDEGDVILIPNLYAKKCEILLDKETFLPIRQIIYDEKGLYEKFEYKNVNVNPNFEVDEMQENYLMYGF